MNQQHALLIKRINTLRSQLKDWDKLLEELKSLFTKFPSQSITTSRRIMEYMTYDLCDRHSIEKSNRKLYDLLSDLFEKKIIPDHLIDDFNYIRRKGNNAAHANKEQTFSIAQAETVIALLCSLLEWYRKNFKPLLESERDVNSKLAGLDEFELLKLGSEQVYNTHYEDAIRTYDFMLRHNAHAYEAMVAKSYALIKLKKIKEALDQIKFIPRDDIEYAGALRVKGHVLSLKGENEQALKQVRHALKINPDCSKSLNLLGFIYHELNKKDQAKNYYSQAIELNPKFLIAVRNRAIINKSEKNYDDSLADYNKVIELEPENILNYIDRALVYERMQEYNSALSDYLFAIKKDPSNATYYAYVSNCYMNIKYYQDVTQHPEYRKVYKALEAKKEQKNYAVKTQQYEKAADLRDEECNLSKDLNTIRNKIKKEFEIESNDCLTQADIYINKALELTNDDDYIWYSAGILYHNKGDFLKAKLYYEKAIELNDTNSSYFMGLGKLLSFYKDYENAIKFLKTAYEIDDKNKTESIYYQASTFKHLGQIETALDLLNKLIVQDPNYEESYSLRASIYRRSGKFSLALQDLDLLESLVTVLSDFDKWQRHKIYISLNNYKKALEDINALVANGYDLRNSYALQAENYYKLDKKKEALESIDKYFELTDKNKESICYYLNFKSRFKESQDIVLFVQHLDKSFLDIWGIKEYYFKALLDLKRYPEVYNECLEGLKVNDISSDLECNLNHYISESAHFIANEVDAILQKNSTAEILERIASINLDIEKELRNQNYELINGLNQKRSLLRCSRIGDKSYWLNLVIEYTAKVITKKPNNYSSVYYRGQAFYALKKYDKSLKYFTDCFKANYSKKEAYYNMIVSWENLGKLETAKAESKKLAELFPEYKSGLKLMERLNT